MFFTDSNPSVSKLNEVKQVIRPRSSKTSFIIYIRYGQRDVNVSKE